MSKSAFSCINWHFLKITVLTFFIISLVIFGLQRRTLSQIKALKILFWPCFIIFSPMINICWAIMSRLCIILWTFFYPPFIYPFVHLCFKLANFKRSGNYLKKCKIHNFLINSYLNYWQICLKKVLFRNFHSLGF